MKIYVSHSCKYDFKKELYAPLKGSTLFSDNEFIFPHEDDKWTNSKEIIKNADLLIAEVSYPTTGLGIELGWANAFEVPIICIYKTDELPTRSLGSVTDRIFKYSQNELLSLLEQEINKS